MALPLQSPGCYLSKIRCKHHHYPNKNKKTVEPNRIPTNSIKLFNVFINVFNLFIFLLKRKMVNTL